MNPERKIQQLRSVDIEIPKNVARWLAGAFEIAGSVSLSIRKDDQRLEGSMSFGVNEEEADTIQRLVKVGGVRKKHSGSKSERSHEWSVRGRQITPILAAMSEFLSSYRKPYYFAMQRRDTYPGNLSLGGVVSQMNSEASWATKDEFAQLVKDSAFLAGVYDLRGRIERPNGGDLYITVQSSHKGVLDALATEYGGKVYLVDEEGEEFEVEGYKGKVTNPSFAYHVYGDESIAKLLGNACPQLKFERKKQIATKVLCEARARMAGGQVGN